jgi:hypothetical protein
MIYDAAENVLKKKNKAKSWEYGYDDKYDIVVISKDGTIGDIYNIIGLLVALPAEPDKMHARGKKEHEQYWQPFEYPQGIT